MMGSFGGSNKNIGIGCADGKTAKWIHTADSGNQWGIDMEELMERMVESTKATIDYFAQVSLTSTCSATCPSPVTAKASRRRPS